MTKYKKSSKSTATITPNWFQKLTNNALSIGQENQFASTRGLRYGPLRINKTGIFVNNGTLDSTVITSTGFHGYGLTGSEQITLDASTGVNVTDGTNSVFKAEISGTNVGDVTMGAYGSGAGAFFDNSTSTFYIKGNLSVGSSVSPGVLTVGTNVGIGTAFPSASAGDLAYEDMVEKAKLGTTIISGGYIVTDLLTADNIVTGTLTGRTVQSSTGDNKIVLDNGDYIKFYAGGNLKCQLRGTTVGDGGLGMTGDLVMDNDRSVLIKKDSDSTYGGITVSGGDVWVFTTSSNKFYLKDNSYNDLFNVGSSGMITTKSNTIQLYDKQLQVLDRNISFAHDTGGGNDRITINSQGSVLGWDRDNHWFHMPDGTDKSAIIKTSQGFNALYCAEAPEVWFFDFCETKKDIDPMFLEVTEGEMRFIKCDKGYQVWRRRKGHSYKRFEPKTALQFYKNEAFLGLAK